MSCYTSFFFAVFLFVWLFGWSFNLMLPTFWLPGTNSLSYISAYSAPSEVKKNGHSSLGLLQYRIWSVSSWWFKLRSEPGWPELPTEFQTNSPEHCMQRHLYSWNLTNLILFPLFHSPPNLPGRELSNTGSKLMDRSSTVWIMFCNLVPSDVSAINFCFVLFFFTKTIYKTSKKLNQNATTCFLREIQ